MGRTCTRRAWEAVTWLAQPCAGTDLSSAEFTRGPSGPVTFVADVVVDGQSITLQPSLAGANLDSANFQGARLVGVNLQRANLNNANFRFADLRESDFSQADLAGADLRASNLQRYPAWPMQI